MKHFFTPKLATVPGKTSAAITAKPFPLAMRLAILRAQRSQGQARKQFAPAQVRLAQQTTLTPEIQPSNFPQNTPSKKNGNHKWLKAGLTIGAAAGLAAAGFALAPQAAALGSLGYLGIGLIAFLSSATVILPAPGMSIILGLSRSLSPVWIAISAGIGAGLGEISGYLAGRGLRLAFTHKKKTSADLPPELKPAPAGVIPSLKHYFAHARDTLDHYLDSHRLLHAAARLLAKSPVLFVFTLAAIPNPLFDVIGLAAGALRMKPWKFLLATIAGNIAKYFIVAKTGNYLADK